MKDRRGIVVVARVLIASAFVGGCATAPDTGPPLSDITLTVDAVAASSDIPGLGTDSTLDIGTWNLEWFGDPSNGPSPEDRQLDNVATLMDATGIDIWAVEEVVSEVQFQALLDRLPRYDATLANDPDVTDGPAYYNDFGGNEQKVGLIWRSDAITVDSARVILTDHDYDFAGRPPVKFSLTVGSADTTSALTVIVLHAKAGSAPEDRDRRENGAIALQARLDARYPNADVLVIGDFNDDVDTSIATGHPSPYAGFVDSDAYAFTTAALSADGDHSTVFYPEMIDHQLATDELLGHYVHGSAQVVPADQWFDSYPESTSDHYPVVARYILPGGAIASGPARVAVKLEWDGAETALVDLYRDGAFYLQTENDGVYVDSVSLPVDSVVYRVCETEATVCSPSVAYRP